MSNSVVATGVAEPVVVAASAAAPAGLRSELRGSTLHLELVGDWRIAAVAALERQLDALPLAGIMEVMVHTTGATALDLSGAWLLHRLELRLRAAAIGLRWADGLPEPVQRVAATLGHDGDPEAMAAAARVAAPLPMAAFGREVVAWMLELRRGLEFIGRTQERFNAALLQPRLWRPISIARHVYDTGITAIPIVSLIAFLISVIIAYMGAQQLLKFGADVFVVDLVTVGVLREMGVLLTAIIVAGRSGSAFAAEIGAMRLNEEVDALQAIGVNPIDVLVLPRAVGLVIAMPLLTVIADAVGLAGGALLCSFLLDMPLVQYLQRMDEAIAPTTFWVGIMKAPVFALLIAASGVYRGMQVRGSSRELGRLTTVAVVQSIFLVILADAVFAVLFMELDI
ncbi:MAG: ABC transporter permease [Sinobacteraceae bacterium]|nr:ABC transporter permease [Nevskiaceae bacterium]MCP5339992.1 ABC transporter permease [Nevskiaceae bacterium]MCP5359337.1 ABC transporter permease [Nevskiaceae bacterium]MCP5467454.1 ABC transporter permease [Nevskiaceae bacterium]MCP5470774.1 ABC transporter permease [Nevskiaceae bacterium]